MTNAPARILVVEDGSEYTDALARLAGFPGAPPFELRRAASGAEARAALAAERFDAVLLDVVFDRVPAAVLEGDLAALIARFGGDRQRAEAHLALHQGFYLADALAPLLPAGVRVVLAYDLDAEPDRLTALRQRIPGLHGMPDGTSATQLLALLAASSASAG